MSRRDEIYKIPEEIETMFICIGFLRVMGEDTTDLENSMRGRIENPEKFRAALNKRVHHG